MTSGDCLSNVRYITLVYASEAGVNGVNIYPIEMAERYKCVITKGRKTYYEDGKRIAKGKIPAAIVPLIQCLERGTSIAAREPIAGNIYRLLTLPRELQIETLVYLPLEEIVRLGFTAPELSWIWDSRDLWIRLLQIENLSDMGGDYSFNRAIQAARSPVEMFFYIAIRGSRWEEHPISILPRILAHVDRIMYEILTVSYESPYDRNIQKIKVGYRSRDLYVATVSLAYYAYLVGKRNTAEGLVQVARNW